MEKYKFNIEEKFNFFLEKMNLDIAKMSDIEIVERKRAFVGGASLMFLSFLDLEELPTEDALYIINHTKREFDEFWEKEIKR